MYWRRSKATIPCYKRNNDNNPKWFRSTPWPTNIKHVESGAKQWQYLFLWSLRVFLWSFVEATLSQSLQFGKSISSPSLNKALYNVSFPRQRRSIRTFFHKQVALVVQCSCLCCAWIFVCASFVNPSESKPMLDWIASSARILYVLLNDNGDVLVVFVLLRLTTSCFCVSSAFLKKQTQNVRGGATGSAATQGTDWRLDRGLDNAARRTVENKSAPYFVFFFTTDSSLFPEEANRAIVLANSKRPASKQIATIFCCQEQVLVKTSPQWLRNSCGWGQTCCSRNLAWQT